MHELALFRQRIVIVWLLSDEQKKYMAQKALQCVLKTRTRDSLYVSSSFFMYDVWIFSTFYIRTKLDLLLYQLSSLFFHRSQMRYWALHLFFFYSSQHTYTNTHIACSVANYVHIFISISHFSSSHGHQKAPHILRYATLFYLSSVAKSLYVCEAFHKLHAHHYVCGAKFAANPSFLPTWLQAFLPELKH